MSIQTESGTYKAVAAATFTKVDVAKLISRLSMALADADTDEVSIRVRIDKHSDEVGIYLVERGGVSGTAVDVDFV